MRPLRPNSKGMFVPTRPRLQTTRPDAPLSRPDMALHRLDRQRRGDTPKILVIRSRGGIGDVLMTTPTVRAISEKYGCKVDYCTDFDYLDGALVKALQGIEYIGEIIDHLDLPQKKDDYDAMVNLTCPCVVHEVPKATPVNRIDLFARHAGIALKHTRLDYRFLDGELDDAKAYLQDNGLAQYQLVLVQPSSSSVHRDLPPERMVQAINMVAAHERHVRFLIITHGSDNTQSNWNMSHMHVLHDFDVRQLSAIMHYCDLVLCPDSAVLHMAAAQSKPAVTLFGPTDPRARVNYHPEAIAIWPAKHLSNYPVWYQNPNDGYLCWKMMEPSMIAGTMHALLKKKPLPPYKDLVTYGSYRYEQTSYEIL